MIRTRGWAVAAVVGLVVAVAGPAAASADVTSRDNSGAPGSTIKVGIKPLDPFVIRDGDQYRGFSIDLWNQIARRNSWQTSYVWHDTLPPLLKDVQTSTVDVGIAGITITKDREQVLDFSYPMFSAGLEVMTTRRGSSANWTSELTSFVTAGVGRYLLALLVGLIVAGHLIWLATRRYIPSTATSPAWGRGSTRPPGSGWSVTTVSRTRNGHSVGSPQWSGPSRVSASCRCSPRPWPAS